MALDNLSKTIPPIDSDQRVALLHAPFKGTTLFGGELAKIYRANKECAIFVTVYQAVSPQIYSTESYTGRGKSFKKGGSSYRRGGRDIDLNRSTHSATVTKPSKSGYGPATMTVSVPQDLNKHRVLLVPNVHVEAGSQGVIRNRQNNGVPPPPPQSVPVGGRLLFCGGVEVYNERC